MRRSFWEPPVQFLIRQIRSFSRMVARRLQGTLANQGLWTSEKVAFGHTHTKERRTKAKWITPLQMKVLTSSHPCKKRMGREPNRQAWRTWTSHFLVHTCKITCTCFNRVSQMYNICMRGACLRMALIGCPIPWHTHPRMQVAHTPVAGALADCLCTSRPTTNTNENDLPERGQMASLAKCKVPKWRRMGYQCAPQLQRKTNWQNELHMPM